VAYQPGEVEEYEVRMRYDHVRGDNPAGRVLTCQVGRREKPALLRLIPRKGSTPPEEEEEEEEVTERGRGVLMKMERGSKASNEKERGRCASAHPVQDNHAPDSNANSCEVEDEEEEKASAPKGRAKHAPPTGGGTVSISIVATGKYDKLL
jgi:hypothetical protein